MAEKLKEPLKIEEYTHAIDLFEGLSYDWSLICDDNIKSMSEFYNKMVQSEEYAKSSGLMFNALNSIEEYWSNVFPHIPRPTLDQRKGFIDIMNHMGASYFAALSDPMKFNAENHMKWTQLVSEKYPIAQSAKETIWTNGIVELYHYQPNPSVGRKYKEPLILVFALMNTPWILDLYPGNSFVEYMVDEGYDVYLVNWGSPTLKQKDWNFSTYVKDILPQIVDQVKQSSGSQDYSMLGWCLGALISSLHASQQPKGLKNLLLLTPPLDFSDDKLIFRKWIKYMDVDLLIRLHGNMPESLIDMGAQTLKPIENSLVSKLKLYDKVDDARFVRSWQAMSTWLKMNVPMAGATFLQLTKRLYVNNELTQGNFDLDGSPAKLENIEANVVAVIADKDHITPPSQMELAFELIDSKDKTLLHIPGGHIGIMAGSKALETWKVLNSWLKDRSSPVAKVKRKKVKK